MIFDTNTRLFPNTFQSPSALFGFGAHKGGGTVTRVMKATGCDDKTAMSLLAKTGGDWQAAAKLGAA